MKGQIIKQFDDLTLLKITSKQEIGDQVYVGTRYEIWTDTAKMNEGVRGEDGFIYCRGFSGSSEQEVIEVFNNMLKRGEGRS